MRTMPLLSPSLTRLASAAIIAAFALNAPAARAQHNGGDHNGGGYHGGGYHGSDFHGRDFGHFSPAERGIWRGGQWEHGWHDGRFAWWWTAGGGWYFYPEPVYPFPTYVPPAIIVQQAPPAPSGLPPSQFWYFCDNPQGYYPYVAACNGPWREVPAKP
jgi:hypothetical protein